jgi:hypothetical protein
MYDMHRDHQHCRPPTLALCISTTRDALSDYRACLTHNLVPRRCTTPTPSTLGPPRHDMQQALPFLWATIDAGALQTPHTGARRAAPACAALEAVRIYSTKKPSPRTRGPPSAASHPHVRRAAPPTAFLPSRWTVAYVIRRDYQRRWLSQGTVYSTTTPYPIPHATTNPLHAACDVLRDCDFIHARYSVFDAVSSRHALLITPACTS